MGTKLKLLGRLWLCGLLLWLASGCGTLLGLRTEVRYPPEGQFVRAGGYDIHYVQNGSGPPVIYIHGSMGTTYDVTASPLYAATQEERLLIAYDRPGSGYTRRGRFEVLTAEDHAAVLAAFIEKLGIRKPILIGHSWGGSVALALAVNYPGRAGGLLLLAPAAYPWKGSAIVNASNVIPPIPLLGDLFMETVFVPAAMLTMSSSFGAVFAPDPVPGSYPERAGAMAIRPSHYIAGSQDMNTLKETLAGLAPRYPTIDLPLTIIHGREDTTTPLSVHAEPLVRAVPGARLVVLENAGHQPLYAHPEAVLAELRRLLDLRASGA